MSNCGFKFMEDGFYLWDMDIDLISIEWNGYGLVMQVLLCMYKRQKAKNL